MQVGNFKVIEVEIVAYRSTYSSHLSGHFRLSLALRYAWRFFVVVFPSFMSGQWHGILSEIFFPH